MKFSGKMQHLIILTLQKNEGVNLSLEDTFLEKPQENQTIACPLILLRVNFNCLHD